jgi:phytoene desaturase
VRNKKVIIIGAGVAGLATSARLAARGFEVEVYERADKPGGKLNAFTLNGYRFDAGPSLFTMPQFVEELLKLNPTKNYHFNYSRLNILCNYFYSNGIRFNAPSQKEEFIKKASAIFKEDPNILEEVLNHSQFIYKHTHKIFIENSLHEISTYLKKGILSSILALPRIGTQESMHAYYKRKLRSKELIQYFNRYATYNGSNPYKAPATLHVIPHIEHGFGAYLPQNGMRQIADTLFELAKDLGVKFMFNQTVEEIIVEGKQIRGVQINHKIHEADFVVSNSDVYYTYRNLLPRIKAPEKILNQEKSSSALIFYWGIKKEFKELDVHNIFFSKDYEKEFNHIFSQKNISDDPTVYVHITSKLIKQDAPKGSENWFVMINVPANYGQDWPMLIKEARNNIIKKINTALSIQIEDYIECENVLDPVKIDQNTSSHLGSLYGYSSNSKLSAFFRHSNFHSSIKGLYFCGGSVHPGGGIPMCLMSAKIIDQKLNT